MSIYWEQVYRGMVKYGKQDCAHNIKSALDYIDRQLSADNNTAAEIKKLFLGRTAERNTNEAFSDILFYPLSDWQKKGVSDDLDEFCQVLVSGENNSTTVHTAGKELAKRWANWQKFIVLVNTYLNDPTRQIWCEGPERSIQGLGDPNCRLGRRLTSQLGISWAWQSCMEWGYFQPSNLGPHALGSKFNTLQYLQDNCYKQFPDAHRQPPSASATNAKFGGWKIRPSNTFWTGGEFDPWRPLSPLSNEPASENYQTTTKIPGCGQKQELSEPLFGYLLEDAQHSYDFLYDPVAFAPQDLFAQALKQWLTCFHGSTYR